MNMSTNLAKYLGTPFDNGKQEIKFSSNEKIKYYDLAINNKIGLFYLSLLKKQNEVGSLIDEYQKDLDIYRETCITAVNLSKRIKYKTNNFAIFKFFKPFPHTPSDTDVLFFLKESEFFKISEYLISNGYYKIGESPSQVVIYDERGGLENMDTRTVQGKRGKKYYIDLYNSISASHVIYLNKEVVQNYRKIEKNEFGDVQTLDPIADIPIVLTHSLIPEQLFTLADLYYTLYYIKGMSKTDIIKLIEIFKKNNMIITAREIFSIIASYHFSLFGFIPDEISFIVDYLNIQDNNVNNIANEDTIFPYRFSYATMMKVLLERMKNETGFKSIITQFGYTSISPRMAKWVAYNIILRGNRETY